MLSGAAAAVHCKCSAASCCWVTSSPYCHGVLEPAAASHLQPAIMCSSLHMDKLSMCPFMCSIQPFVPSSSGRVHEARLDPDGAPPFWHLWRRHLHCSPHPRCVRCVLLRRGQVMLPLLASHACCCLGVLQAQKCRSGHGIELPSSIMVAGLPAQAAMPAMHPLPQALSDPFATSCQWYTLASTRCPSGCTSFHTPPHPPSPRVRAGWGRQGCQVPLHSVGCPASSALAP